MLVQMKVNASPREHIVKKFVITPFRLVVLAALGMAAATAGAQSMVTARVLSTQPVTRQVPVSDCGPYGGQPSGAGAGIGAVTGGLVGSQLGKGSGHIAGAILGAVGGAIVGNAVEAGQSGGCVTRYSQQVIGYDVVYEYAGRQYSARMDRPPGQWVQVRAPGGSGDAYADPPPDNYYPDYQPHDPAISAYPPPAPVYPPAYRQPYPPSPGYPVYSGPVYARPAPVYVTPPVGIGLSIGGRVGRHGGIGIGVGF
jgi:uncharacterized protein YcfJ